VAGAGGVTVRVFTGRKSGVVREKLAEISALCVWAVLVGAAMVDLAERTESMLDETVLRKPGFTDGHKVRLADGQEWVFPRPRIRLKPKIVDGRVEIGGEPSFGPEYDDQLDVLFGAVEVDDVERLRVKFEMAVRLLSANYELKPEDYAELIVLEPGEPASMERWEQLSNVLLGMAPKPLPAT